ncbi:MAG TPA: M13 family metallopeptidase [Candidatus Eremiobacteraceae bacterium]|nr:M13 family metallopeptidase [Candidatus Eremiobacteraceae bacterium]
MKQASALALLLICAGALFAQTASTQQTFSLIPGLDRSLMDTTADPCVDFYQYACGNWSKLHPIPNDSPYSDQFYNLDQYNRQVLHGILEKASADDASRDATSQKIGDYYASCMDEAAIQRKGLSPLQPELDRINALSSKDQLPDLLAHFQLINVNAFLGFGSQQDFKDATRSIAAASQNGLGLPEKDYYLRTGPKDEEIRTQYVQHVTNVLKLLGSSETQAAADAAAIMKLETALAKVSLDVTSQRDPHNVYHIMPNKDLQALTPVFNWERFYSASGSPGFAEINVAEPEFFKGMNQVISQTDLPTIKAYLRWQLVSSIAGTVFPKALDEEKFDFGGRKLAGIPEQEPRWKRCVQSTDGSLPEALGKAYVDQQFPGASKEKAVLMIRDVEAAMDRDIDSLDWMSAATKARAKEKLHLIANKVGYPDKWRDYSKLEIVRDDAFGNNIRAAEFESRRQLAKIGKPVDRQEWLMSPPTVNAYYNPSMNDINFPAGVLQLAFFDAAQPDALNYGHIGLFMAHEITHGFDDQGRQFDGHGNLEDWWTKEDGDKFTQKEQCIVDEYAQFSVGDTKLNGKLTLGENTADNGGLRLAYMAFLARAAQEGIDLDKKSGEGYTPVQEMFVGFTQDWCAQWRPEVERLVATTDPHSPDRFRANGVLVNMPEFGKAFGCRVGQPMAPPKTCRVW